MAKKKAKARCRNCGAKLSKWATSCPGCGTAGGPGALKSAGRMLRSITKSAGTAAQGPQCGSCRRPQAQGTRFCTGCGALMPGAQRLVVKSAAGRTWSDEFRRESDPERRELLWRMMHPQNGGGPS